MKSTKSLKQRLMLSIYLYLFAVLVSVFVYGLSNAKTIHDNTRGYFENSVG